MTTISLLLHYYLYVLLDSKALNESVKITELDGFTSFLLLRARVHQGVVKATSVVKAGGLGRI